MSLPLGFKHVPHEPDPLGEVSAGGIVGWDECVRRIIDIGLSVVCLAALFPVFLLIAVLIKFDSPGPIIFTQVRVGRGGRCFRLHKFRSMYVDAEARRHSLMALNDASGPLFKIRQDPRVTRIGRFLRRSSLDEFPQLLNVLLGEMTLVGPRPALPSEVATYGKEEMCRLLVKPGLTGLWQISGRADLPYEDAIRLDLSYVKERSIFLDLVIILKTIPAVIGGRGAY